LQRFLIFLERGQGLPRDLPCVFCLGLRERHCRSGREIGFGALNLSLCLIGEAAIQIGCSEMSIKRDGLIGVRKREVIFAFPQMRDAPVVPGGGELGLKTERLIVVGNGSVILAFAAKNVSPNFVSNGIVWLDAQRLG
jgi:hypothetical protein